MGSVDPGLYLPGRSQTEAWEWVLGRSVRFFGGKLDSPIIMGFPRGVLGVPRGGEVIAPQRVIIGGLTFTQRHTKVNPTHNRTGPQDGGKRPWAHARAPLLLLVQLALLHLDDALQAEQLRLLDVLLRLQLVQPRLVLRDVLPGVEQGCLGSIQCAESAARFWAVP